MQFSGYISYQPNSNDTILPTPDNDFIRVNPPTGLFNLTIQLPDSGTINLGAIFYFHFDQPVTRIMWNLGAGNTSPDTIPTAASAGQVIRLVYVDSAFLVI